MRARTPLALVVVVVPLLLASCDDDGPAPEPLLASTLSGSYDGDTITPVNGFATVSDGHALILVGDGPIGCGSESGANPPRGRTAAFSVGADLAVGDHTNVSVQMIRNVGDYEGVGSNSGSVSITSVTDESVVGAVAFDYTSSTTGKRYTMNGTFEVVHCAH